MNIAIVNNCVPFIKGGAEFLADGLRDRLAEYGHRAMVVKIPFAWDPPSRIPEHMLACRLLRLENIDRVIALKFPAYYIHHPDKVLWLVHQFRQVYDLWDTPYRGMAKSPDCLRIRDSITGSDNDFLGKVKKRYAISKLVAGRLRKFNNLDSTVLYPPLDEPQKYSCTEYGDYVFYPSRIVRSKRQGLAVESMKYVRSSAKLVIAGNPDSKAELDHLEATVRKNNLGERVRIISRWISQEEKISLFAGALGCMFIPYDEDYGYVSLEAFYSHKPLITCTDSGGPLEFVDHKINGFVVDPEPKAIAGVIDDLFMNRSTAEKMGQAGHEKIRAMDITWHKTITKLTE